MHTSKEDVTTTPITLNPITAAHSHHEGFKGSAVKTKVFHSWIRAIERPETRLFSCSTAHDDALTVDGGNHQKFVLVKRTKRQRIRNTPARATPIAVKLRSIGDRHPLVVASACPILATTLPVTMSLIHGSCRNPESAGPLSEQSVCGRPNSQMPAEQSL